MNGVMNDLVDDLVDDLLEVGFDLIQVKAALEDGEWQGKAGITQAEAEAAYAVVLLRIAQQAVKH